MHDRSSALGEGWGTFGLLATRLGRPDHFDEAIVRFFLRDTEEVH